MPSENEIAEDEIAEVSAWLDTKGITLWADFMITDPNSKREAAKWFIKEMEGFFKWWDNNGPKPVAIDDDTLSVDD